MLCNVLLCSYHFLFVINFKRKGIFCFLSLNCSNLFCKFNGVPEAQQKRWLLLLVVLLYPWRTIVLELMKEMIWIQQILIHQSKILRFACASLSFILEFYFLTSHWIESCENYWYFQMVLNEYARLPIAKIFELPIFLLIGK